MARLRLHSCQHSSPHEVDWRRARDDVGRVMPLPRPPVADDEARRRLPEVASPSTVIDMHRRSTMSRDSASVLRLVNLTVCTDLLYPRLGRATHPNPRSWRASGLG